MPVTANERLKRTRIRLGFNSAREAAKNFGWTVSTYTSHESGVRGLKPKLAQRYAEAYGVSADWLMFGDGPEEAAGDSGAGAPAAGGTLPVVGYIGAGVMYSYDDFAMGDGLREIDAPPGVKPGSLAVIIRGDSMAPAYHDGDHVIYSQRSEDVESLVGGERIVWLDDGRTMLKKLLPGTAAGLYTLISHNAEPIGDVKVMYAARIEWVRKA